VSESLFATIRERVADVSRGARFVRIDARALARLAERLALDSPTPPVWDVATHHRGTPRSTLAYVITLDAINFGSGWFPKLRKRNGRSGYFTVAMGLKDRFDAEGPWSARELGELSPFDLARVTGQDVEDPAVVELLALFAASLNDLGEFLERRHAGSFASFVEAAEGRAERLVRALAEMPLYRDVSVYDEFEVPFYKRAQITAADLSLAFDGESYGRFEDLAELTAFADNLVPHVLRMEGVLQYRQRLGERIDAGELLDHGSPEEVEIRAVGVHAVEEIAAAIRARGGATTAQAIDYTLWHLGQRPEMKAHPRHRARCPYY
jgi:Potential Queuosine, Q, salvage protein family